VIAAIAASPLVWPHYLTLLFVPIALLSPRISPLWFVPLIAYFAPVELTHSDVWKMVPYLAIELIIVGGLFLTPNRASVFNPTSWGRRVHAKRIAPGPGR
jgi:hypothetical protein